MSELFATIISVLIGPLALWAWLSMCAAERMWRDDQDDPSPVPEGWDAVRRFDRERRHD